jgi:hypothetical protein
MCLDTRRLADSRNTVLASIFVKANLQGANQERRRRAMEMTRAEVFERLRELGAVAAVVPFHGGYDEGFIEGISLKDAEGNAVAVIHEDYYGNAEEPFEGAHGLAEALSQPVYDEYGGFAGQFEVEGRVIWDVSEATVSMEGSEAEESPEDVEGSEADWVPFEKGL